MAVIIIVNFFDEMDPFLMLPAYEVIEAISKSFGVLEESIFFLLKDDDIHESQFFNTTQDFIKRLGKYDVKLQTITYNELCVEYFLKQKRDIADDFTKGFFQTGDFAICKSSSTFLIGLNNEISSSIENIDSVTGNGLSNVLEIRHNNIKGIKLRLWGHFMKERKNIYSGSYVLKVDRSEARFNCSDAENRDSLLEIEIKIGFNYIEFVVFNPDIVINKDQVIYSGLAKVEHRYFYNVRKICMNF